MIETAPPTRCIFCRLSLGVDHPASEEHVIPQALGGWLTIDCLGKPCNDRLGHDVDRLVNTQMFLALRRETGLETARSLRGSYVIRDLAREVEGLIESDGTVIEVRRVWEEDDSANIIAETPEEARAAADHLNTRRVARGKRPLKFGEVTFVEGRDVEVLMGPLPWEAGQFELLLGREAAKIALDYIAYLSGADVALDPRLDELRVFAIEGDNEVRARRNTFVPPGTRAIYLPRTRRIFAIAAEKQDVLTAEELKGLLPDPSGQKPLPTGVAQLDRIFHLLRVRRDGDIGIVEVVLFNLFGVAFELPLELSVPWGAGDVRDFTTGETRAVRPSPS